MAYYPTTITTTAGLIFIGGCIFQLSRELLPIEYTFLLIPLLFAYLFLPRLRILWCLSFGFLWSLLLVHTAFNADLSTDWPKTDLALNGVIQQLQIDTPTYSRFVFVLSEDSDDGKAKAQEGLPSKLLVSWYNPPDKLLPASQCQLQLRLRQLWRLANPGSSDYQRFLFSQGIVARAYVRQGSCQKSSSIGLRQKLLQGFSALPYAQMPLMQALVFSERTAIDAAQWRSLHQTGTTHLLAISGLHISIIGLFSYFLLFQLLWCNARICSRIAAQRLAAFGVIPAILAYAYLADFSIPTQRAVMMATVAVCLLALSRRCEGLTVLSISFISLFLFQPFLLLEIGFYLSFSAVLIILIVLRIAPKQSKLRLAIYLQLALSGAMIPISLYYFEQASLLAPLANLLAIPWVSFIVLPLLLIGLLLWLCAIPLYGSLLALSDASLALLMWFLDGLSAIPMASFLGYSSLFGLICFEIGLLVLLLPLASRYKLLSAILMLSLWFYQPDNLQPGQLRLSTLDVAQGSAVLVEVQSEEGRKVLLYDAGARYRSGFSMGQAVIAPFLRQLGISQIDLLLISHNDDDHVGGLAALIEADLVNKIMRSQWGKDDFQSTTLDSSLCHSGMSWRWGQVHFEILHPSPGWQGSENNRSCVLSTSHPAGRILLTGDIEKAAEYELLRRYRQDQSKPLHSRILQVPHHGSASSSTLAFLKAVQPQLALFSYGQYNRYHFPHATILKRYQDLGIDCITTADAGVISLLLDVNKPDGMAVDASYRERSRRYWHRTDILAKCR
jgi:competence protein ComEC